MTHCRSATEMCTARCADGRATMTTDASSTIMSWATAMTARDQYRLGSGGSTWAAILGTVSVAVIGHLRVRGAGGGHRPARPRYWPSGGQGSTIGAKVPF